MFDLLMRRTWAAGHNAFRGNRVPTNSTHSKCDGENGFSRSPVSTGLMHYTRSALPNSVDATRLIVQAARPSGSLYAWPLVMMAQIILAVLLASAAAATFVGRRAISRTSHGRRVPFRSA